MAEPAASRSVASRMLPKKSVFNRVGKSSSKLLKKTFSSLSGRKKGGAGRDGDDGDDEDDGGVQGPGRRNVMQRMMGGG